MYSPLDDFRSLIGDPSIMERAAPVDGDWRNVALPRYKRVFRFAVGTSGFASTKCSWRTGGLWLRRTRCTNWIWDPNEHRQSPPAVSTLVPLPTSARSQNPLRGSAKMTVRYVSTTRVWGLLWGRYIVAVATGMPLRATGDYFLDGFEY